MAKCRERESAVRLGEDSEAGERAQHSAQRRLVRADAAREHSCRLGSVGEVVGNMQFGRHAQQLRHPKPHDHVAQPHGRARTHVEVLFRVHGRGSATQPRQGRDEPRLAQHRGGIDASSTVDLGNHQVTRDNSNGFMFIGGPSRRYVASLESDGIKSVSSLPGGESGDPSSQFYVNLLRRWLTNEAFPLRTDVLDVPDHRDDDDDNRDDDRNDDSDGHRDRGRR